MKKISILLSSAIAILSLSACSQVAVMPQANNQYQLVATSSSSTGAIDAAMAKANEICEKTNQKPVVVQSNVEYNGMSPDAKGFAEMAAGAINMSSNANPDSNHLFVPGPDTSQDYTATVTISCQ